MRVLYVIEASLRQGRGPLFRRLRILEHLSASIDPYVLCLGQPAAEVQAVIDQHGHCNAWVEHQVRGWNVVTAPQLRVRLSECIRRWSIDIVVVDWEIWDVMLAAYESTTPFGIPAAVILHAVPFVNAPSHPQTTFEIEVQRRLAMETNPLIRRFIKSKAGSCRELLESLAIIVPNRTVEWYLRHYFPSLSLHTTYPGYALDTAYTKASCHRAFDFVFMGKCVEEKGILMLAKLFARICATKRNATLQIIGDFEDHALERQFWDLSHQLGVASGISMAGWLNGRDKYCALSDAHVFLHPASESDTFCIALCEALACGCTAVVADAPFARIEYGSIAVVRSTRGDLQAFAYTALEARQHWGEHTAEAIAFAQKYRGWGRVADAEWDALCQITS